ncbi:hypothetical protein G5B37_09150 [Rasiella rasia]|uniref:Uncharacterized protein n=2 Tax=Rasiella rasia TaxID=2744027 RepID=A0A6G6GQM6_9FLAO|nr:hypothetical protein G5B37_09150 [Rasiella rasia]
MLEVAEKLKKSDVPVVKKIHDANGTKILAIGLRRGVSLAKHKAPCKARLLVIKGEVDFNTEEESMRFACYESYDIPMNVTHSVEAWDDAICLLFLNENS